MPGVAIRRKLAGDEVEGGEYYHHYIGFDVMLLSYVLIVLVVAAVIAEKLKLPASSAAILIGAILGGFFRLGRIHESELLIDTSFIVFDEELFLYIMLPPIIFEAGFSLSKHYFFGNLGTVRCPCLATPAPDAAPTLRVGVGSGSGSLALSRTPARSLSLPAAPDPAVCGGRHTDEHVCHRSDVLRTREHGRLCLGQWAGRLARLHHATRLLPLRRAHLSDRSRRHALDHGRGQCGPCGVQSRLRRVDPQRRRRHRPCAHLLLDGSDGILKAVGAACRPSNHSGRPLMAADG